MKREENVFEKVWCVRTSRSCPRGATTPGRPPSPGAMGITFFVQASIGFDTVITTRFTTATAGADFHA